uniref:Uncharacterized protein n=1 Tax=Arundo donax TaxID=35708 RepID=A0A0A9AS99_ARUDO
MIENDPALLWTLSFLVDCAHLASCPKLNFCKRALF